MSIGQKIKQARIAKGLTQEELGKIVGVQKSAIAKYENGRIVNIKRSTIQKLADVLSLKPSDLIFEATPEIKKENDVQSDIVSRMFDDKVFLSIVEDLNKLDDTQLLGIRQMLTAFLK